MGDEKHQEMTRYNWRGWFNWRYWTNWGSSTEHYIKPDNEKRSVEDESSRKVRGTGITDQSRNFEVTCGTQTCLGQHEPRVGDVGTFDEASTSAVPFSEVTADSDENNRRGKHEQTACCTNMGIEAEPQDAKYILLHKLKANDCDLNPSETPHVYKIPTEITYQDEKKFIRKCIVGLGPKESVNPNAETKIILTVGATGAGKTTLVNGLINYALGVDWKDPFRFQILADKHEREKEKNQAVSQTTWVTAYTLYPGKGNKIPYILTIIDTPGFGDTQGLEKDEELLQKLRSLFESKECAIECLHGVCFVTQSSLPRLTPSQKYVFDGVLSIFGKDVGKNIFMLFTFCDAKKPPVIDAIKEAQLPYKRYFKFNNSALFANNVREDGDDEDEDDEDLGSTDFNRMFWKVGFSSFKKFFIDLSTIIPVSLVLTVSVLEKREQLQAYISRLQENIQAGILTMSEIDQEKRIAKDLERDIDINKKFKYTVDEHFSEKIDKKPGQHVTNCQHCNRTCHDTCVFSNDEDKKRCIVMDTDGYCKVCTREDGKRCIWSMHYNQKYYFKWGVRKVEKTAAELFAKYEIAVGQKRNKDELIQKINEKFERIRTKVLIQTYEVRRCLIILSEIALKPNPLSTVDYIEQMISSERMSGEPGWKKRIEQLEKAKEKAQWLQKLAEEDGRDPLGEVLKEMKYDVEVPTASKSDKWYDVATKAFEKKMSMVQNMVQLATKKKSKDKKA